MKHTMLTSILLTFLLFAQLAAAQVDNPAQTSSSAMMQLLRATITVSDPEKSIHFYRDLLGFTVSSDSAYDSPALRHMFRIPEDATPRFILLDGSPAQARALGLVSADGLVVDAQANSQNAPALVFNVETMDEIDQRLQAAGVVVISAPSELIGFNGKPVGREAMYLDPDGVRIVLFELAQD